MEVNVGERGPIKNCGHIIDWMDKNCYRLIDIRKTYIYPKTDFGDSLDDNIMGEQYIIHHFKDVTSIRWIIRSQNIDRRRQWKR